MASGVSENEFVAGRRSGEFGTRPLPLDEIDKRNRKLARQLLWDALRGYSMTSGNKIYNPWPACRELHCNMQSFILGTRVWFQV